MKIWRENDYFLYYALASLNIHVSLVLQAHAKDIHLATYNAFLPDHLPSCPKGHTVIFIKYDLIISEKRKRLKYQRPNSVNMKAWRIQN